MGEDKGMNKLFSYLKEGHSLEEAEKTFSLGNKAIIPKNRENR